MLLCFPVFAAADALENVPASKTDVVVPSHAGILVRPVQPPHDENLGVDVASTSANTYYAQTTYSIAASSTGVGIAWAPCPSDAPYAFAGGWSLWTGVDIVRSMRKSDNNATWRWYFKKNNTTSAATVTLNVVCTATPKNITKGTGTLTLPPYSDTVGTSTDKITYIGCTSANYHQGVVTGFEVLNQNGYTTAGGYAASMYYQNDDNYSYFDVPFTYGNTTTSNAYVHTYGFCDTTAMYFPDTYSWGYDAYINHDEDRSLALDLLEPGQSSSGTVCGQWNMDVLSLQGVQLTPEGLPVNNAGRLHRFNNVTQTDSGYCLGFGITDVKVESTFWIYPLEATEAF